MKLLSDQTKPTSTELSGFLWSKVDLRRARESIKNERMWTDTLAQGGMAWHFISRRWLAPRGGGKQPGACNVPEENHGLCC